MEAGSRLRRRARAIRQRLQRIEDTDRDLHAIQVRRRVVDLREPVRVDVAVADRAERRVGRSGVAAVGAHAEQRHVIQDRIRAEQADVAAGEHGAHVLVAEGQENLTNIEAGGAEGGVASASMCCRGSGCRHRWC